MIRPVALPDVEWAARQHAALMEHSVFAKIGTGFLECFYREFAVSPHSVSFVHEQDSRPQAVIACTSDRRAFMRGLFFRSGLKMAFYIVKGLFRRDCRRTLFQSPGYLGRTCNDRVKAEMIFITVSPECRGTGIARSLIEAVLAEYRRRGVVRVNVSIESDNAVVKNLLLSMGFKVIDAFVFADKSNDLLETDLTGRTQPEEKISQS